jgi:hypothetical protein
MMGTFLKSPMSGILTSVAMLLPPAERPLRRAAASWIACPFAGFGSLKRRH